MTPDEIFAAVEAVTGVNRANLVSRRRGSVCKARQLTALLLTEECNFTQSVAGWHLNRHYRVVAYEVRRAKALLQSDPELQRWHAEVTARLRQREAA